MEFKTNWSDQDFYNFDDLNRAELNTKEITALTEFYRDKVIKLNVVTNRNMKTIEFADSLNRIEENIEKLTIELNNPTGTIESKTHWNFNQPFSFNDANRLEINTEILYRYVKGNLGLVPYCGLYTTGEEVI